MLSYLGNHILQRLTGGILLSRDKEYIVFYRGKDFLPSAVSTAIEERRRNRMHREKKLANDSSPKRTENIVLDTEECADASTSETGKVQKMRNVSQERKVRSIQTTIARTSRKLSMVSILEDVLFIRGFSSSAALGFYCYRL